MRVMKKVGFLTLLLITALFVENAAATLSRVLPESSYYQGSTYYNDVTSDGSSMRGRIDFAVYDTSTYQNEFVGSDGFQAPGGGRYIYAYQIFNNYNGISEAAIESFTISSFDGANESDIGAQDDGQDGKGATYNISQKLWQFNGGVLWAGEHSYFLVFSTNHNYTSGSYDIQASSKDPVPVPAPEPSVMALLGLGSTMILIRPRKCA